jgi:hypothetical protein
VKLQEIYHTLSVSFNLGDITCAYTSVVVHQLLPLIAFAIKASFRKNTADTSDVGGATLLGINCGGRLPCSITTDDDPFWLRSLCRTGDKVFIVRACLSHVCDEVMKNVDE